MEKQRIGIIGAGNMAEALIHGMITSMRFSSQRILVSNRSNRQRLEYLTEKYKVVGTGKKDLVEQSDAIVLAMKPQDLFSVIEEIKEWMRPEQLCISIAAGVDMASIQRVSGLELSIVRAMPNTSAKVLCSATAIAKGENVTEEQMELVRKIFSCVGTVREVEEEQMDVVTGLSGSGPAYVYSFLEAMIDGGHRLGLSQKESTELVLQTLRGAVEMMTATGMKPAELSQQICSPNGTTVAGLAVLRQNHFKESVMEAIKAATLRSKELRKSVQS